MKKEICLTDIIPVYREVKVGARFQVREVGKIKVLSHQGENYFEAQVVSETVKAGDIATKESAWCSPPDDSPGLSVAWQSADVGLDTDTFAGE